MIIDLQKYEKLPCLFKRKERKDFYTLLKIFLRVAKALRSAKKNK